MNFSQALEVLKEGGAVTREVWKKNNVYVQLINYYGSGVVPTPIFEIHHAIGIPSPWAINSEALLAADWELWTH